MTETTYSPLPGTIAARVLAWFADQAPEHEASSGVIADALDQPIAAVITALEPVFEHGLISREKRDGRLYWSVGHRPLRVLSGPHVNADDDDFPIVQRVVAAATPSETPMNKPNTSPPPSPKKPRAAAPAFDPLTIEIVKGRTLPPTITSSASRYQALLERLQPGDSVDLPTAAAKSLVSAAKKAKVKLATRAISETVTGVWRL
ncbi:MAG: hypothetical protein PVS3B2_00120 [Candidatus Dormibacteraceae bacterium]